MKKLLLAWLLLIGFWVNAQAPRKDVIHKLDRQTLSVKVDNLTPTEIFYRESVNATVKKKIARSEVWKIVFANGKTQIINPLPGLSVTNRQADRITLLNGSVISGKIVRRDDSKLYYTRPEIPGSSTYELLLARIDNIRYSDGRVETIRKAGGEEPAKSETSPPRQEPVPESKPTPPSPAPETPAYAVEAPATSASTTANNGFERIHLTIGPEVAYYPTPLNRERAWLNDSTGFGMRQNVGGSLRFDYRFLKPLAVSVTIGYFGWELVRRYTLNGADEYAETKKLTQIPATLGVKFYPAGSLYIMPEGGITMLRASVQTSERHPTPASESVTNTPVHYGASVGYELRGSKLLLDLSLRYRILNVKNLNYQQFGQSLNERVSVASLRLGIGFRALKR